VAMYVEHANSLILVPREVNEARDANKARKARGARDAHLQSKFQSAQLASFISNPVQARGPRDTLINQCITQGSITPRGPYESSTYAPLVSQSEPPLRTLPRVRRVANIALVRRRTAMNELAAVAFGASIGAKGGVSGCRKKSLESGERGDPRDELKYWQILPAIGGIGGIG
jgi:hypothetical protein